MAGCESATGTTCPLHADDREAYGNLKRSLAQQGLSDVMHYNNAKASLIYAAANPSTVRSGSLPAAYSAPWFRIAPPDHSLSGVSTRLGHTHIGPCSGPL